MAKYSIFIMLSFLVTAVAAQTKAFPSAEGYGAASVGGRGGQVFCVTNLNDEGSGSFREAVEAKGPRIVVFRIAGTISL
ncbi:MAG: pectate lyase, partial [Prolixibacteraceae bacterium]|nr:pectate lyase [Prolixibacteraceae bacterium]